MNVIQWIRGTGKSAVETEPEEPWESKNRLRKEFTEAAEFGCEEKQFKAALKLLAAGDYEGCVLAYEKLAERFKNRRHFCEMQIARAYLYQGDPEKALEFCLAAKVHGADPVETENIVWDACMEYREKPQAGAMLRKYLTLFPDGRYSAAAQAAVVESGS
jgi:outer membrane protein assembly factor BamD (BamD/ComL family)